MARIVVIRPSYRRAIVRKAGSQGGGGGGGTTDHAALSSNLPWTTSGHTGTSGSGVHLAQFSALGAAGELAVASNVVSFLGAADYAAMRTQLSLGTAALLASDADTTLAANSDARLPTQKAVKAYVDASVAGLLDLKGGTDCSANPNYPSASKGDAYYVTVAGKIGGASGKTVEVGDVYVASADNAGGTEASVGTSWFVLEHNLTGALVAANNLSDLTNAATARSNLSLGNVENTALSTWAGTANITTLGTIATGTWNATPIATAKIADATATPGASKIVVSDVSGKVDGWVSAASTSTAGIVALATDNEESAEAVQGTDTRLHALNLLWLGW